MDQTEPLTLVQEKVLKDYEHLESFDDFVQLFMNLYELEQEDMWAWADATLAYSERLGNSLKQLASSIPRSKKTLESYRHTAETFGIEERIPDVPFSIHRICAYTDDPKAWLQKAADSAWSSARLKREIQLATGKTSEKCLHLTYYCAHMAKPIDPKDQCKQCQYCKES